MKNLDIVILAAGKGTRMAHPELPKVLVPLGKQPLIAHILKEVKVFAPTLKPVVIVGYKKHLIKKLLGDGVTYCWQKQQLGTAHAVAACKNKTKAGNILVLAGDMPFISSKSLERLCKLHEKSGSVISMFTSVVPHYDGIYNTLLHFGRIIRDSKERILRITEYKDASSKERQVKEVNPAIYLFDAGWLWQNLKLVGKINAQGEYYLTDLVKLAVAQGKQVATLSIPAKEVLGVNTKEELDLAHSLVK